MTARHHSYLLHSPTKKWLLEKAVNSLGRCVLLQILSTCHREVIYVMLNINVSYTIASITIHLYRLFCYDLCAIYATLLTKICLFLGAAKVYASTGSPAGVDRFCDRSAALKGGGLTCHREVICNVE